MTSGALFASTSDTFPRVSHRSLSLDLHFFAFLVSDMKAKRRNFKENETVGVPKNNSSRRVVVSLYITFEKYIGLS